MIARTTRGQNPKMGCFVCATIVPVDFESASPMSGIPIGYYTIPIDRLQSWASFEWMHDNAIHDLPSDV
jgi:hypothetical protein